MNGLLQDVRYGVRGLARDPGFAAVAVLALALGIGANTAVYSLTDQILLRPLPVRDPGELVVLRLPGPKHGRLWADTDDGAQSFSYPFYLDLRDRTPFFSGVLARFAVPLSVAGQGRTERAAGELVSGNYFEVLGVRPGLGRLFTPDDDRLPGGHPVAVLSHGYWTRRFGASPAILNQNLVVNNHALTVVGVAPAAFRGVQLGETPDLFVPITMKAQMTPNWNGLDDRRDYWLQMIGRLRPGVTLPEAEAGLVTIVRPLLEQEVAEIQGPSAASRARLLDRKPALLPGARGRLVLQEEARRGLLLLSGMVGLVLLIACANVAGLLIARSATRRREIAVRLALGAPRAHLVRQLLVESLLLAAAGGAAGLLIAAWSIDAMPALLPRDGGLGALAPRLDPRVLAFTFGISLVSGVAFGLLPAFRAARTDLVTALKEQGPGAGTGAGPVRLRKTLVVLQIAVTAVLLTTAGLFARTLGELRRVDLGLRADNLLAFSIEPELNGYSPAETAALFDRIREDLAAAPGVASASLATIAVLTDNNSSANATIEGFAAEGEERIRLFQNWVGPGYFATLGIPLLAGREIAASDRAAGPKVAVVNETTARMYFAGRDPIGRRFAFGAGSAVVPDIEIVGVVKDSKHATVRQEPRPFVYLPYAQDPALGEATFYLRSALPPEALAAAARDVVRRHDANLPVSGVKTLVQQRDESLHGERLLTALSLCFGLLAALLASIGLYGVMAYAVSRRTSEIGIRMALGASRGSVRGLVLREAMLLTVAGLAIGLPAAFASGNLAGSLLFGVRPGDPRLLAAAAALLVAVMLLAAYVPARRAARLDPAVALRCE